MLDMHLRQPGITYSACRPFTKKEIYKDHLQGTNIKKIKETKDLQYICLHLFIKIAFNMAWVIELLKI